MDALTSFIIVIIAITIQISLYTIKRLKEPLELNYLVDKNSQKINSYDWFFSFDNKLRLFWVDNSWVYLSDKYI